jgi:8-oxo-dGTP diphosphatase
VDAPWHGLQDNQAYLKRLKPRIFNPMILVAAGFIFKDHKLLIAQRLPGTHGALKWELPGGKVENDEDPRDCLVREVKEELGIQIEVGNIFESIFHRYPERSVLLLFYKCRWISGEARPLGCANFAWIDPQQLPTYDFLEADLALIKNIAESGDIR